MSKALVKREVIRNGVVSFLGTGGTMCAAMLSDDVPEGSMSFNFDPTKEENFGLLDLIDEPATREGNQHAVEPFKLQYWFMKKVRLAPKGDQPERLAVLVMLISPDGDTLQFTSKGVLTSMDMLRTRYGDGPYNPPLPITVREVKMPNKFWMTKLRVMGNAVVTEEKK